MPGVHIPSVRSQPSLPKKRFTTKKGCKMLHLFILMKHNCFLRTVMSLSKKKENLICVYSVLNVVSVTEDMTSVSSVSTEALQCGVYHKHMKLFALLLCFFSIKCALLYFVAYIELITLILTVYLLDLKLRRHLSY